MTTGPVRRWATAQHGWDLLLLLAFVPQAASWALIVLVYPAGLGTHANIYTDATAAWLSGGDPWTVGPPAAMFAGPPPMLLPFLPFVGLPPDVVRFGWFFLDLLVAAWAIRKLGLPAYWLAFPPIFESIVLGHIEILVLGLIVLGGPLSGLAIVIKPYAAAPLLAERRWSALLVGAVVVAATIPLLPWTQFFADSELILSTIVRQNVGDPIFGDPIPMAIGAIALATLGLRRALWLAAPLLWPYAQPIYKSMTLPVLSPVLAFAWALPIEGFTLIGVVALAILVSIERFRPLPPFLKIGIEPASTAHRSASEVSSIRPRMIPV